MAAPVWTLSIDLQTKTATFTSGMAEAAKSARGSFNEIRSAAKESGEGVAAAGLNVRSAIGLVDNTIRGAHAMAIADLVREFQHTAIVMAALPFAVTVAGIAAVAAVAVEVAEKIKEWREAQEKLTEEQTKFGTAINESFNGLDDRILQAGIRADELRNNHLGALSKALELIDHASMQDLVKEFETISKAAEGTFKLLEGHWYTLGIGSAGAVHALDTFKTKYDNLLSQGKDAEAADLLKGTRESAERTLGVMESLGNMRKSGGLFGNIDFSAPANALATLYAGQLQGTQREIQAQKTLVQVLRDQETAQGKIAAIKKLDEQNANTQTSNDASSRASAAARAAAQNQMAIAEQQLASDKAIADARLTITNASVSQRLESDTLFAARDYAIKQEANRQDIAALDKSGKDYQNQLKALQEKQLELEAQHANAVTQLRSRASVEQYKKDLTDLEQSEREKIAATDQGSAERLAAIDAAMKEAQSRGLQETDYYRQLSSQRVETARQEASQEAKLKADASREEADNTFKMAELQMAAESQQRAVANSSRRMTEQQNIAEQLAVANQEFQIKQTALQQQAAALDASGKDYENKLKAIHDKELQLIRQHEIEKTQIENQSTVSRNQRTLAAYNQLEQGIARSTASMLIGQQSFAQMMNQLGSQIVAGMIQNALMAIMANDMTKPSDAAKAAREAFGWGWEHGGPAAPALAPLLAAGAFASVMAFASGTDAVPGVGKGDTVPAMLTPGEGVVPGGVMDGLRKMANSGGFDGSGQTIHVHVKPTYHLQALDGKGIDRTLKNHTNTLTKHFNQQVRRMNK